MKRLLTIGCSYTFYKCKTWADYLGQDFTHLINLIKKYLKDDHPIEAVHELYCTTVVRPLLLMSNNKGQ